MSVTVGGSVVYQCDGAVVGVVDFKFQFLFPERLKLEGLGEDGIVLVGNLDTHAKRHI